MIFLGYGLIQLLSHKEDREAIVLETAPKSELTEKIAIDVAGAVLKPGVYKLASDARIQDGLVAAGGISEDADRAWIDRYINLAAKVADGTKIYIPFKGENMVGNTSSTININSASQSGLESLSGIGPVAAEKIIANRPYGAIDELLTKKVVGKSVFEKIKDHITTY